LVFHYRPERAHYPNESFIWGSPEEFAAQGYPQTGLYRNGELVYTVEAPILGRQLYFSNDGMSFLMVGWWVAASGNPGMAARNREPIEPAARFFSQGNFVHSHEVFDLVENRNRIIYSVGHAQWDFQSEREHNRENNTLRVLTRDERLITFDLSTGLVASTQQAQRDQIIHILLDDPVIVDDFLNPSSVRALAAAFLLPLLRFF